MMQHLASFLCVAAGGALGASLRYAISLLPCQGLFPVLTLFINFAGAICMGAIVGFANGNLSPNWQLFLKVGLCGGFTTFSTFSMEAFSLLKNGHTAIAAAYIILSVALCLFGVWGGFAATGRMQ